MGERSSTFQSHSPLIHEGTVSSNDSLCREHFRLRLRVDDFRDAQPGQFVHLCPLRVAAPYVEFEWTIGRASGPWAATVRTPMLRRAFSIAGLRRENDGVFIEVIHRVVGKATHWLESLKVGDRLSVMGPLGNRFPVFQDKSRAWLVAGGVGLPPMLWLSQALRAAGREVVAFCGVQRAELLPLTMDPRAPLAAEAREATLSAREFARHGVPVIVSTDDGSLGFRGHVGAALEAYHANHPAESDDVIVYTCGPERMMRFVAEFCLKRGISCYESMERNMACGLGTCQSCAVPTNEPAAPQGWRYRLCCTDGPVFDARELVH